MRVVSSLLAASALLLGTSAPSPAYQPPVVVPGGTFAGAFLASNPGDAPVDGSARARARGIRLWNSPRGSSWRGPWVEVAAPGLAPGETREVVIDLPVPEGAPPVLTMEVQPTAGGEWTLRDRRTLVLVESAPSSEPPTGRRVPHRVVAGGIAAYDPEFDSRELIRAVVRETTEWDALRERLGIVSPDSWGLHPDEGDPLPPYGGYPCTFASAAAPDLASETLLAIRTPAHGVLRDDRRLWVRSVDERPDGTLVCRYSWRFRRIPSYGQPTPGVIFEGQYLLVAIPRTDAPIEFRRVP